MSPGSLLAVVNFPANTGYAWERLEGIYAEVADRLRRRGITTFVAYPSIESPPRSLTGSAAIPVELDVSLDSWHSIRSTVDFVSREKVQALYFMDRPAHHPAFPILRAAGVEHIVVHDNTSGARTAREGLSHLLKKLVTRIPGIVADRIVTASEFVARRQARVNLTPPDRISTIYYAVEVPDANSDAERSLTDDLALDEDRPLIGCTARAAEEKGVGHLIKAVRTLMDDWPSDEPEPVLVYCGSGPKLEEWKALAAELGLEHHVVFPGYVENAVQALPDARVFAVPSVWQDAFPYAVLEPMAHGKPVVGSRVGGIPEQIEHGETGFLVEPGDPTALAESLSRLLLDPERASRMGKNARRWVSESLAPETQYRKYAEVVEEGFQEHDVDAVFPAAESGGEA